MIMYFSATGNTKFAAELLAEQLGDELVSLNEILKKNKELVFKSEKPFVLVSPIYAWRLPRRIEKIIANAEFVGSNQMYTMITMGSYSGATEEYCKRVVTGRGMEYMGFCEVCMPDNYVVTCLMPSKNESIEIIRKSLPDIYSAADKIAKGEYLGSVIERNKSANRIRYEFTKIANAGFNSTMTNKRAFKVSDSCTACGTCVRLCPINNISIKDGKAVYGKECMFCLACLHGCPYHAIDFKGRAQKNGYYRCPKSSDILNGYEG